jgi:hypothetical protein
MISPRRANWCWSVVSSQEPVVCGQWPVSHGMAVVLRRRIAQCQWLESLEGPWTAERIRAAGSAGGHAARMLRRCRTVQDRRCSAAAPMPLAAGTAGTHRTPGAQLERSAPSSMRADGWGRVARAHTRHPGQRQHRESTISWPRPTIAAAAFCCCCTAGTVSSPTMNESWAAAGKPRQRKNHDARGRGGLIDRRPAGREDLQPNEDSAH